MDKIKEIELETAIHYLEVLRLSYSIMQPEIREAIDFAIINLRKQNEN